MATLSVRKQGEKGEVFRRAILKRVTTVGSAPDCDVVLDDESVEPLHAMVVLEGTSFHAVRGPDVRHVCVGGARKKKAPLEHHDDIEIGPFAIRFHLFDEPQAAPQQRNEALLDAYRRLHQFSLRLAEPEDVRGLLERLLDDVMELAHGEKGFIFLTDENGGSQSPLVGRNLRSTDVEDMESSAWSDTIVKQALESRQPVIVSDAMREEAFRNARSVVNLRLASVLCVPLLHRDTLLGVLYLGNNNVVNLFTAETLSIVTVFAAQASMLIHSALLLKELKDDRDRLQVELEQRRFGEMIGASDCMQAVFRTIERVAGTDLGVLIEGETGTGKELVAREIHRRSARAAHPFVAVNCGAIPENLLESELFGHVRGAFSGAVGTHKGLFERANKGTLLLDEIGELPPPLQVKLLRVIQEQVLRPVGSERDISVDVRLVAATNRDIEQCVQDGTFREDLFYRLNAIRLMLPPLRARGEDVALIARYLLKKHGTELNPNVRGFSPEALRALAGHVWPGNVRELENRIKKATVMAEGAEITPYGLDLEHTVDEPILPLGKAKERYARDYVFKVLSLNNGNRTRTAEMLGVDPRTVYRYLESERTEGS